MVLAKSLQHKGRLLAIVTRVAIQINCKLGGEAWSVQMPLRVRRPKLSVFCDILSVVSHFYLL